VFSWFFHSHEKNLTYDIRGFQVFFQNPLVIIKLIRKNTFFFHFKSATERLKYP
jgi:hypothetical protein